MRILSWPNAISLLRLPLAAAFIGVETQMARAVILAAAAFTDFLDGWLARRLGQSTRAGEVLDPITDRIFVFAALAGFAVHGLLAPWQLLVLLARDVFTTAAFAMTLAFRLPVRVRARPLGKVVTALQIIAVLVLLVRPAGIDIVVIVTGAVGAAAIVDYTRAGWRALRGEDGLR